jgi:hypothetical protein
MDAHDTHCCIEHGCKYGDHHCPITNGQRKQANLCEVCGLETEGYFGEPELSREQQEAFISDLYEKVRSVMDCECLMWGREDLPVGDKVLTEHHVHCPKHPSHAKEKVNCLVCDKVLEYEPGTNHRGGVMDAGFMLVSFHFGSRHDQCHGFHGRKDLRNDKNPVNQLLACDEIEAFICDDCFEKKFDKMKGYDIKRHEDRIKKV